MQVRETPATGGYVRAGDLTGRVETEQLRARGIDVRALRERLTAAADAELTLYCRCVATRPPAAHAEPRAACDAIGAASREHFEAAVERVAELGRGLPDQPGDPAPSPSWPRAAAAGHMDAAHGDGPAASPGAALLGLLQDVRDGIRRWWEICDLAAGDFRTLALAQRVLDAKIAQEDRLLGVLAPSPAAGSPPAGPPMERNGHAAG